MNRTLLAAICACAAVLGTVAATGDDLSIKPRAGVLLLQNGELIAGTIIAAGDRYDVHLETGEMSIKRSEVAMVCRDAQECYLQKRAGIEPGRAHDHLDLAEWCIKNNLLKAAETELTAARDADKSHPRIRLVEARLALAKEPPPTKSAASSTKRVAPESLDSMARTLPPGTMEQFTSTIQPLLLNYCAKSGCHVGHGAGGLQLERMHQKLAGRFTTQRNLRHVLAQLDLENPQQSKLLQAPIRPHGPADAPIFTDREQAKYRQLVEWVHAMAGSRMPQALPTLAERTAPLLQAVPGASGNTETVGLTGDVPKLSGGLSEPFGPDDRVTPASAELPELPKGKQVDGSRIPAMSADQAYTREQLREMGLLDHATSRVRHDPKKPAPFVAKDPFDPEVFNRRYFGK